MQSDKSGSYVLVETKARSSESLHTILPPRHTTQNWLGQTARSTMENLHKNSNLTLKTKKFAENGQKNCMLWRIAEDIEIATNLHIQPTQQTKRCRTVLACCMFSCFSCTTFVSSSQLSICIAAIEETSSDCISQLRTTMRSCSKPTTAVVGTNSTKNLEKTTFE